jgi:hypothetical protein
MFTDIASLLLNQTVLVIKTPMPDSEQKEPKVLMSYFQVSEIEFYMNDFQNHMDTFTLQYDAQ